MTSGSRTSFPRGALRVRKITKSNCILQRANRRTDFGVEDFGSTVNMNLPANVRFAPCVEIHFPIAVCLEAQLVNCAVKGRQNANAMFKSASFGFANFWRFVLVRLLRAFRLLRNFLRWPTPPAILPALSYAIWHPDLGIP